MSENWIDNRTRNQLSRASFTCLPIAGLRMELSTEAEAKRGTLDGVPEFTAHLHFKPYGVATRDSLDCPEHWPLMHALGETDWLSDPSSLLCLEQDFPLEFAKRLSEYIRSTRAPDDLNVHDWEPGELAFTATRAGRACLEPAPGERMNFLVTLEDVVETMKLMSIAHYNHGEMNGRNHAGRDFSRMAARLVDFMNDFSLAEMVAAHGKVRGSDLSDRLGKVGASVTFAAVDTLAWKPFKSDE